MQSTRSVSNQKWRADHQNIKAISESGDLGQGLNYSLLLLKTFGDVVAPEVFLFDPMNAIFRELYLSGFV
jgi:hypothetical protein